MNWVAVFVDAGYLFAQGSAELCGRKLTRNEMTLDYAAVIAKLKVFAETQSGLPLLRVYWYDGASQGPTPQHNTLARLADVKVRLGLVNSIGQQKGVDSLIVTDMLTLARNGLPRGAQEALEEGLYFRMADLLNLDVEVVFYDTTSLHFEVDEEDTGVGEDDEVRGSRAAGAKTYRAVRKRGKSKNGRGDVPQVMVGLAVTRDGFPVRHWVFPRAMAHCVLLSGDEDLRVGVQLAQECGVRVHLVGIKPARGTQSVLLFQEADATYEWASSDLSDFLSRNPRPAPGDSLQLGGPYT